MSDGVWVQAVTWLYLACNGTRLFAYVTQTRGLMRCDRDAQVAIGPWLVLTAANGSTVGYGLAVQSSRLLVLHAGVNFVATLVIVGLAWRRKQHGRRGAASPLRGAAEASYFYAAAHATVATSVDRLRDHRPVVVEVVDATLVDAVARHQRRPVRRQFGALDLAARIGVRAARMERAA